MAPNPSRPPIAHAPPMIATNTTTAMAMRDQRSDGRRRAPRAPVFAFACLGDVVDMVVRVKGWALDAAVGVHSAEEVVTVVGEDHRAKAKKQNDRAPRPPPTAKCPSVQVNAVDQPGE